MTMTAPYLGGRWAEEREADGFAWLNCCVTDYKVDHYDD
jgi:hypothetical protein